jgi:hypothetical protein
MEQRIAQCLEVLGLRPGVTIDAINTTYYTLLKRFPENPTEEDERALRDIKRAYDVLRRAYVPPKKKAIKALLDRRMLIPVLSVLLVVTGGTLAAMNWSTIKIKMTHYEKGDVMRLKTAQQPYGEILAFDDHHEWPAGNPSAAYAIRLYNSQQIVWVGERAVVNGMTRAR